MKSGVASAESFSSCLLRAKGVHFFSLPIVKTLNISLQQRPAGMRGNYRSLTLLFYMHVIAHLHKQEMRHAEDTTSIMASQMSVHVETGTLTYSSTP